MTRRGSSTRLPVGDSQSQTLLVTLESLAGPHVVSINQSITTPSTPTAPAAGKTDRLVRCWLSAEPLSLVIESADLGLTLGPF